MTNSQQEGGTHQQQSYVINDQKRRRASKMKVFIEYKDMQKIADYQESMQDILQKYEYTAQ